jgi:large subunit ribosomal protein L29
MTPDKIRDLSDEELVSQENDVAEQIFRLRFQVAMGQSEGAQKLRSLKKDVARIKTVQRQRQLEMEEATE